MKLICAADQIHAVQLTWHAVKLLSPVTTHHYMPQWNANGSISSSSSSSSWCRVVGTQYARYAGRLHLIVDTFSYLTAVASALHKQWLIQAHYSIHSLITYAYFNFSAPFWDATHWKGWDVQSQHTLEYARANSQTTCYRSTAIILHTPVYGIRTTGWCLSLPNKWNMYVCMYVCGFISCNPYSLSSHKARP